MIVVLYRWKIKEGKEEQFVENWSRVTEYILENYDSKGSRLHRGSDGIWYAYAQWKSPDQRETAFRSMPVLESGREMRDAIQESFEEIILTPVADFLVK